MKKTALMGFGNPVRSDDGVGCYVIERLQARMGASAPDLTLIDMGTSAFEVLFQLQGHTRIIVVDAVINTGEPDGTLYRLPAEAVAAAVQEDPMVFLHSLKWDQALSYASRILGPAYPDDITVYLIAVSQTRLEMGLSPEVMAAGDKVADMIAETLISAPV
ncbi:MAG: hydrogenase maturation protease [Bacteroidia bacterium]|nr:hydrogenase maturation protease [Bacteroidia bacterium]